MDKLPVKHKSSEEDYGFVSGLLKARESQFISPSTIDSIFALNNVNDIFSILPERRYKFAKESKDSLEFEKLLFKSYIEELEEIKKYLPEDYLLLFLLSIHSVIYKIDFLNLNKDKSSFSENIEKLVRISRNGTDFSKVISSYIVDKFNISEEIRAYLNKEECKTYYKGGNISEESLKSIFNSSFSQIPFQIKNTLWSNFLLKDIFKKKSIFELALSFENYWRTILLKLGEMKRNEPYGLDYVVSYFLRFLIEILNLNKAYIYIQYNVLIEGTNE